MSTNKAVIVTDPNERRVVVAVDKYHGNVGEYVMAELSKREIRFSGLQGPQRNEGPVIFRQLREYHSILVTTNANRTF